MADTSTIPPDDPLRKLTVADPDGPGVRHVAVVGDTYSILVSGTDTAGRYCLIDMIVPDGGGPPPHRHDFEEMFTLLEGELEFTFRGEKRPCVRARRSTFRPMRRMCSGTPLAATCTCSACARRPGRRSSSWRSVIRWRAARRRDPGTTRPRWRSGSKRPRRSLRNTARNC